MSIWTPKVPIWTPKMPIWAGEVAVETPVEVGRQLGLGGGMWRVGGVGARLNRRIYWWKLKVKPFVSDYIVVIKSSTFLLAGMINS